jgi:hypothetical protein
MKRTSFVVLILTVLTFVFSFSFQLNANGEKKTLIKRPDPPTQTRNMSHEELQAKRQRLLEEKNRKREMHDQYASMLQRIPADNTKAVNIVEVDSYTYWQNGLGDVHMTALCYNAGSSYAAMIEAEVIFYDYYQNYLGYDIGYVYGGTYNVQYGNDGYCTNELAPDEYGFFYVWPEISYADAYYYSVSFTAVNSTSYPFSNAMLDFDPYVYYIDYLGYLNFYGDIANYSSNYVTYSTEVHFAVFNNDNTKVIDVDWTFVDGSTYGASTSAIYPGTSEPFDLWFLFAEYNNASGYYLSAFEWYEDYYNPMPERNPPFGSFDTPIDGSTVASSIAVTGWALDDSGVASVKIYRGSGNNLVYIGDATMVQGARPDVAAAYPQYPNNTKAGWGYMMLTNFLPNGGNGTFKIHAIATDTYGKSTTLGTKTIYCKNASAVKPFGAIDTPTQGGTASGSSYVNWGWALTPQPKYIPSNGSTINVYVDGVYLGHPTYNIYRADIAGLFPSYANSSGAVGYFYLDTTAYSNGVHTIYWTARDNTGATDGIGSRYFTISNSSSRNSATSGLNFSKSKPRIKFKNISQLSNLPLDYLIPVKIKRGFNEDFEPQEIPADEKEMNRISIKELERIEITLSDRPDTGEYLYSGYTVTGNRLGPLPIGSTLDERKGIFYWHPGAGFLGRFNLVFVETKPDGEMNKKNIIIEILPGQYQDEKDHELHDSTWIIK